MTVQVQFVRGKAWTSKAIGYTDDFSHMDIVLPTGRLFGARSDRVGGQPPGVWDRPDNYEVWAMRMRVTIPTTAAQAKLFYDTAWAQRGKKYDKWAIAGFIFRRDWREDDSWICSELGMYCLEVARIVPKLWIGANKIDPGMAAMACTALSSTWSFY